MRSHIQARPGRWRARRRARRCAVLQPLETARRPRQNGGDLVARLSALVCQHRAGARRRRARRRSAADAQRRLICACGARRRRRIDVGLVDDDEVGELDHALLDRLQVVAGVGQLQQHEHVGHAGDRRLALADADGLDDDDVVAGGLARRSIASRVFSATPPSVPPRGRGPDERARVDRQSLHARLVAEDRAAGDARADGSTASTATRWPPADQVQAQRLDEGRLADPGNAGDAEPERRLAGARQQRGEQGVGALRGGRRGSTRAA